MSGWRLAAIATTFTFVCITCLVWTCFNSFSRLGSRDDRAATISRWTHFSCTVIGWENRWAWRYVINWYATMMHWSHPLTHQPGINLSWSFGSWPGSVQDACRHFKKASVEGAHLFLNTAERMLRHGDCFGKPINTFLSFVSSPMLSPGLCKIIYGSNDSDVRPFWQYSSWFVPRWCNQNPFARSFWLGESEWLLHGCIAFN